LTGETKGNMNKKIALTFDVEDDCPPFQNTTYGIKEGLPKILQLLDNFDINSTFFVTGEIGEKFPEVIKEISKKHEIGSHGYIHEPFNEINQEKRNAIKRSKKVLENIIDDKVIGFRAPYLEICNDLYPVLEEIGFKYDSSKGTFMRSHYNINTNHLQEFELGISNVILRLPGGLKKFKKYCNKNSLSILFFHPWEAINMRTLLPKSIKNYYMRPNNWYKTGNVFMKKLESLIEYLIESNFEFIVLRDLG